jgi:hypothetical protein
MQHPKLPLQLYLRPVSQEDLESEVKITYKALIRLETECIHVDRAQAAQHGSNPSPTPRFASGHWQVLIDLHVALLHKHHDFFLASQHPLASPALRKLAAKYSMPERLWRHGIHPFLELLRYRLPESMDCMLTFLYHAYRMMGLLYEVIPAFENTWMECLGDLSRYGMSIEEKNRETWAAAARSWYGKAAGRKPAVGRLYHHLGILARPDTLGQL